MVYVQKELVIGGANRRSLRVCSASGLAPSRVWGAGSSHRDKPSNYPTIFGCHMECENPVQLAYCWRNDGLIKSLGCSASLTELSC